MAKNLTRNEIKDLLCKSAQNIAKTIESSGCLEEKSWITSHSYIKEGQDMTDYHCQACGEVTTKPGRPTYWYRSPIVTCSCGNNNFTNSENVHDGCVYVFIKETDDGAEFAKFSMSYSFSDGVNPWYLNKPTRSINLTSYGMFHRDYGWFVYDVREGKLLKKDSQREMDTLAYVRTCQPINKSQLTKWTDILTEASSFETKREVQKQTRKNNSKVKLMDDMRSGYRAKSVDDDMLTSKSEGFLSKIYSQDNGSTSYIICCVGCGHTDIVDGNIQDYVCPICGNKHNGGFSYYGSRNSKCETVVVLENTRLPDNDLLLRLFRVDWNFDIDAGLTKEIRETQRIFFGKKIFVYDPKSRGSTEFEKTSVRYISDDLNGWRMRARPCQTDEEMTEIIKQSCLVYSGLIESWGFDPRYNKYVDVPNISYLLAWYKNPGIELVLKANLTTLVEHYVRHNDAMGTGTNLAEVLGVEPAVVKMVIKMNPHYSEMKDLNNLYKVDNTVTREVFDEIKQQRLSASTLTQLKRDYDINYDKALKYLQAVYDNQCINKPDALHIWIDYLRMASMLRIDLTDKTRKFPGSLKKEHDVAMFAYQAVQVELDKERFANQAVINQYYEYTYKELMVKIPMTPQDIVEEATKQRNCLRSYVERVKNGDTVVAFIRKKEAPDETYITAEIHNGELIQLKGYCNSNPRNAVINEFVEHWSKAKKIRVMC